MYDDSWLALIKWYVTNDNMQQRGIHQNYNKSWFETCLPLLCVLVSQHILNWAILDANNDQVLDLIWIIRLNALEVHEISWLKSVLTIIFKELFETSILMCFEEKKVLNYSSTLEKRKITFNF